MLYSDSEQLIWATKNNRVIYTFNVGDFCKLHEIYMSEGQNHQEIIVVERQSYSIGEQLRGIEKLIDTFSSLLERKTRKIVESHIRLNAKSSIL